MCVRRTWRSLGVQEGRDRARRDTDDGGRQPQARGAEPAEDLTLAVEQPLGGEDGSDAKGDAGHVHAVPQDRPRPRSVRSGGAGFRVGAVQAPVAAGEVVGHEVAAGPEPKDGLVGVSVDPSVDARHGVLPNRPSRWPRRAPFGTGVPDPL